MKDHISGRSILEILVNLLADQEGVTVKYDIQSIHKGEIQK